MIGILMITGASWLLLYILEKRHLDALGLTPVGKRVKQLATGFLIAGLLCSLAQLLEVWLKSASLELSENASLRALLLGAWWDFKSVLTEELIFRGALLYIFIQRFGSKFGIAISATAFGIYHWFSYGILGNPVPMVLIFVGTGLMGYGWALSFHKTQSIMLGLGLHLGWNIIYNTLFSKGPLGEIIFVIEGGHTLHDWASLTNFLFPMIFIPALLLLWVKKMIKPEMK